MKYQDVKECFSGYLQNNLFIGVQHNQTATLEYSISFSLFAAGLYPEKPLYRRNFRILIEKEFDRDGEDITKVGEIVKVHNVGLRLNYHGKRYYDSEIGMWTSRDPILEFHNPYAYGPNSPINGKDPDGKRWFYEQSSGNLYHLEERAMMRDYGQKTLVGTGYAGHGEGVNSPSMQNIEQVGPIPRGNYTIGPMEDYEKKDGSGTLFNAMELTPDPSNQMFKRSAFLMHGDDGSGTQNGSHGCPVLNPTIRSEVNNSGDDNLTVEQGPLGPLEN
jgi:RHS repeat-associated protein